MATELEGSDAPAGPILKESDNGEGARSEDPGSAHCTHGSRRLARETLGDTIFLILGKDPLEETLMLEDA